MGGGENAGGAGGIVGGHVNGVIVRPVEKAVHPVQSRHGIRVLATQPRQLSALTAVQRFPPRTSVLQLATGVPQLSTSKGENPEKCQVHGGR